MGSPLAHFWLLVCAEQKKLFVAAREHELCYLVRVAESNLRIGAVTTTVLAALARAFVLHHLYTENVPPEQHHTVCSFERVLKAAEAAKAVKAADVPSFVLEPPPAVGSSPASVAASITRRLPSYLAHATAKLRRAYAELPSFHAIIAVLMGASTNIYELNKYIKLTAGVPVKPQLGRPLTSQALHTIAGDARFQGCRSWLTGACLFLLQASCKCSSCFVACLSRSK